jgi:hypothetical protein
MKLPVVVEDAEKYARRNLRKTTLWKEPSEILGLLQLLNWILDKYIVRV